jgi:serine/threonine-protein kinase
MNPERWRQVDHLFQAALERNVAERAVFLAEACAGDAALRREVESLLAAREQAGSFIQSPAIEVAADLMADEQAESLLGREMSHYRIISLLGAGGMGEVYLAQDTKLGRKVALKLLPNEFGADRERLLRFEREARAASALNHPHVATIYEIGEADGAHFIAMEYVEGQTLRDKINERPLADDDLIELAVQVTDALDEAHRHGVTHRDIKSGNIMVSARGQAKVLDFGLAKIARIEPAPSGSEASTVPRTASGQLLGTVPYMSPEQALGHEVDHRTDIFSLGVVLYEMATGRLPFTGANSSETLDRILHAQPEAIARFNYSASAEIEHIVRKCLEKDRERRYQSAHELLIDLRNLQRDSKSGAAVRSSAVTRRLPVKRWDLKPVVLLACLAVMILGVGYYFWSLSEGSRMIGGRGKAIASLAVLPLENLSGDAEQDYFADGMTEALIDNLSKIGALRVRSRTSVMRYKGERKSLLEIARELKVEAFVEGAVLRSGERVRITARLIEAATDQQVWAQSYERDLRDVLALQSEAARDIAQEIKVRLTPQDQTRLARGRAVNPEAYVAYLRGRHFWNRREIKKAIEYFEQAIAKDPSYAPAYAGLADSYIILAGGTLPPKEAMPKAKEAIMKSLAIDDTLAESHTSLAMVKWQYDRDWLGAEKEFKRAIELNPNYATAHQWYGQHLLNRGQFEEGRAEIKLAQNLDPISLAIISAEASYFLHTQQYDQAIEHFQKTLEIYPNSVSTQRNIAVAYLLSGRYEGTLAQCQKVEEMTKTPNSPWLLSCYGCAYAGLGRREEAREMLNKLIELSQKSYVPLTEVADTCVCLGEKERAIEWLEKAYAERLPRLNDLKINHFWDSLRPDPRFQDLLKRMNIPP